MSDPYFRQFYLDTVEKLISSEPNEQSLLSLLQTVSPTLTLDQLLSSTNEDQRRKLFKSVLLRIHPDKHANEKRVTLLFQNVQNFYDSCSDVVFTSSSLTRVPAYYTDKSQPGTNTNKKRRRNNDYDNVPMEFSIYSKWPYASHIFERKEMENTSMDGKNDLGGIHDIQNINYPYPPQKQDITTSTLGLFQAYKCIHIRGCIAHGKSITKFYTWKDSIDNNTNKNIRGSKSASATNDNHTNVTSIFDSSFGGTKILNTIDDIKDEIMQNGPVISTSFTLTNAYLDKLKHEQKDAFANHLLSNTSTSFCKHELLIVGWSMTPYGEAWDVQFFFDGNNISSHSQLSSSSSSSSSATMNVTKKPMTIQIGFGQFNIDTTCLAPKSNLQNIAWQQGPYFDSDFTDAPQWREWKEMDLPCSGSDLEILGKCLKNGLFSMEKFVIRDKDLLAHSSLYVVKNVRWDDSANEWIITVSLAE